MLTVELIPQIRYFSTKTAFESRVFLRIRLITVKPSRVSSRWSVRRNLFRRRTDFSRTQANHFPEESRIAIFSSARCNRYWSLAVQSDLILNSRGVARLVAVRRAVARRGANSPSFSSRNEERAKHGIDSPTGPINPLKSNRHKPCHPITDRSLDRMGFSGGMRERTSLGTKTKCGKERDLRVPSR